MSKTINMTRLKTEDFSKSCFMNSIEKPRIESMRCEGFFMILKNYPPDISGSY